MIYAVFISIKVIKIFRNKHKISNTSSKKISTAKTFGIIMSATLITVILSYIWTFVVSVNGVGNYHSGLNDDSNAVRFRANVYAVEEILGSADFILFGYDKSLYIR